MNQIKTQLKLLSGALVLAGLGATGAWAQSTPAAPMTPASAATQDQTPPSNRADVKADTQAAKRSGDIPQGEAGTTKDRPKGGAALSGIPKEMKNDVSRADVKAEAQRANAAGEIPRGEASVTNDQPRGGSKVAKRTTKTRAEVRAEAKRARNAGEIPNGEGNVSTTFPKGGARPETTLAR